MGVIGLCVVTHEDFERRAVIENVDGLIQVAAGHHHGARAHLDQLARCQLHGFLVFDPEAGHCRGFEEVGRNHGGALDQLLA